MRNLIIFGLFIILLLAAQFTSAKTLDEVIEKYIRARGGKDRLDSMKSIYMEGTKEINGKEVIIKVIKEQDKLSRTEIETGVTNGFVLITHQEAWTYFPLRDPATHKIAAENLAGLQTEMDIAGPLVDYIAKGHKAELLGKETVEGNKCYKIKLITKEGKTMLFWVDTATFLVNQSSATPMQHNAETGATTFTIYRNYKEVDGIKFAHTLETKNAGADDAGEGGEIFFYKVLVNPAIAPEMYQNKQLT